MTYELIFDSKHSKYNFSSTNRYRFDSVYSIDGDTFFGTYNIPDIPNDSKDTYHQIKAGEEGRWDLISYKYYYTVNYWWIICLANDVSDPFESPSAGTLIRIPSLDAFLVRIMQEK